MPNCGLNIFQMKLTNSEHTIFVMKDKKNSVRRKRDLLYLIEDYLKDEGYLKSAEYLHNEAGLRNEYTVCDNINLETIFIEFESYYFLKFQNYPRICKCVTLTHKETNLNKRRIKNQFGSIFPIASSIQTERRNMPEELNTKEDMDIKPSPSFLDYTNKTENINCNFISKQDTFDEYEEIIMKELKVSLTNTKWEDIKGLDYGKEILKEAIVYPVKYPYLFNSVVTPWKGVLMYGPPGTGKTMLANAASNECQTTFYNISSSSLITKWRGDSEKLIRTVFQLVIQHSPSIIFFDEIDALVQKRGSGQEHEASRRFKSEIFINIDKILQGNDNVFVLAATNLPWDLDEAIFRRFEKHIMIELPNLEARKDILKQHLPTIINYNPQIKCNIDHHFLAEMTDSYSGSDLRNLSKEIVMEATRSHIATLEKASK